MYNGSVNNALMKIRVLNTKFSYIDLRNKDWHPKS